MQSVSSAFIPLILICSALLVTVACPCGMLTNLPIRVNCSRFLCKCQVGPNLDQSFAESMQCMRGSGACTNHHGATTYQGVPRLCTLRQGKLCSTAQHSTAQHSTAQHSVAWHGMAKACLAQPSIALYSCLTVQPWHVTDIARTEQYIASFKAELSALSYVPIKSVAFWHNSTPIARPCHALLHQDVLQCACKLTSLLAD